MARIGRVVAGGLPHHIVQRGNRHQKTFSDLVHAPEMYPWSSAFAHISGQDDKLVKVKPLIEIASDWRAFLLRDINKDTAEVIRHHARIGRPLVLQRIFI